VSGTHEGIDQGDARAGLAGAGRHNQQEETAVFFNAFHDGPNGLKLEIPASDLGVDQFINEGALVLPNVEQPFEVLPRGKAMDLLWRGFPEVPEEDLVPVCVEAER
jgi:hypothetical protein